LTFKELGLNDQLLDGLDAMGFEKATPIQEEAIPVILKGKDLIACAQTGTGKTAAFLLPILHNLTNTTSASIDALILVPTRELAVQIDQNLEGFSYFANVSSLAIYGGRGGESFNQEKKALTMGANIVVATPGRLIAHLNLGYVKISQLKHLILDEADRMLDMGFVNDLLKIIGFLPKQRQTLLFSATMPPKIRTFSKRILTEPEQITFAVSKPAEGIDQKVYLVQDENKAKLLQELLGARKGKGERMLIFSSTKAAVSKIAKSLRSTGLTVGEIHSDFDQKDREETLRMYKGGRIEVLVATDILSRGIDVKDISIVVNYDVPSDGEDYIHRIGRTARADTDGIAITLVNRKDQRKFQGVERLMERKIPKSPLPPLIQEREDKLAASMPRRGGNQRRHGGGGNSRGGGGYRGNSKKPYNKNRNKNRDRNFERR